MAMFDALGDFQNNETQGKGQTNLVNIPVSATLIVSENNKQKFLDRPMVHIMILSTSAAALRIMIGILDNIWKHSETVPLEDVGPLVVEEDYKCCRNGPIVCSADTPGRRDEPPPLRFVVHQRGHI